MHVGMKYKSDLLVVDMKSAHKSGGVDLHLFRGLTSAR